MKPFLTVVVARAIHAANREVQRALAEEVNPPWEDLPVEMRDSLCDAVVAARAGTTPEASHNAWMERRLADGWQLGFPKSLEGKISPNLVSYENLPPEQRAKDALVLAIVGALS